MLGIDSLNFKNIIQNSIHPALPKGRHYRPTSVFLLLYNEAEPHILAIQKSDNKGYPWRNQIALPGGHVDAGDASSLDAAFRELKEELNISKSHVQYIGSIGHFQTINHIDIEVFTGIWRNKSTLTFDPKEISKVLEVPLRKLVNIHKERSFHGWLPDIEYLEYPFQDVVIWGVTAKILHHFIELFFEPAMPCEK